MQIEPVLSFTTVVYPSGFRVSQRNMYNMTNNPQLEPKSNSVLSDFTKIMTESTVISL